MEADQRERVHAYVQLLEEWNERVRLTGYKSKDEILHHLIVEPVSAFDHFSLGDESHPLVDLGSGNGSPGIVFAILAPHRRVCLVERRQKKMTFLLYAAGKLKLDNVRVLPDIAEVGPCPTEVLDVWAKAVSWPDLYQAILPVSSQFKSVRLRKFGADTPLFPCSSSVIHVITVKNFLNRYSSVPEESLQVGEVYLPGIEGVSGDCSTWNNPEKINQ